MADYVDSKTAAQEVDLAAREFADGVDKNLFATELSESVRKAILTAYAGGSRLASKLVMKSMEEGGSMVYVEIMDLYNELVLKSEESK